MQDRQPGPQWEVMVELYNVSTSMVMIDGHKATETSRHVPLFQRTFDVI